MSDAESCIFISTKLINVYNDNRSTDVCKKHSEWYTQGSSQQERGCELFELVMRLGHLRVVTSCKETLPPFSRVAATP